MPSPSPKRRLQASVTLTAGNAETRHSANPRPQGQTGFGQRSTRVSAKKASPCPRPRKPLGLTGRPSGRTRCSPAHGPTRKRPAPVAKRRRASPHPDPTGNGGPRNGDYVRLGGVARDPLPHPARGLASARPPHLPHRPRQSRRGSPGRPVGRAAPPQGGGGPR